MKLYAICKNCSQHVHFPFKANDRAELAKKRGDSFSLKCDNCSTQKTYGVNDIRAKESRAMNLTTFTVLFLGTGFIMYWLSPYIFISSNPYYTLATGSLLLIPSIIYVFLNRQEQEAVRRFNQYWA